MKKSRSHLFQERWEFYQFIAENRAIFPIEKMCKVFNVSKSSFYKWLNGGISARAAHDKVLKKEITEIFKMSKQTYGSPRVTEELKRRGYSCSKPKVAKLMAQLGLKSKVKKKYKTTTDSNHHFPVAPNIIKRNFKPERIGQTWVSDITYIRTLQGWLYLTTVIDLFDRQVIGWSLSKTMHTAETVIPAWNMAARKRQITQELIFHSDRGVQYACKEFTTILNKHSKVKQSMSRKGNCWDNAVAESFFKTLKSELVYHCRYETIEQAKLSVFEYIEGWYNSKRLHSSLGYVTPIEYELNYYQVLIA
ncbi:IS3 family transposase, partial [Carboxylicivirga sp. N1Y90]|uniref:IS3 family transposase n=1 Tax=Carboxylicivirga fragile TaxID=3417571 RepID=UPI003D32D9D9